MSCDEGDSDLRFTRAVIPEYPPGSRRFVLGIGLKDLFSVRSLHAHKLMGFKASMTGVLGEKPKSLFDSLKATFLGRIGPKSFVDYSRSVA